MENTSTNHWPTLYEDPYAVLRIKKSCELLDAKPGMSVLDVGCNKMETNKFLHGVIYHGIDGIYGDQIDGGFNLNVKFDRILCLETLEHLQFPLKTLASIKDHLADDGIAVISLPNEATIFHRIRSLLGTVDAECFSSRGKHLHLPSLKQSRDFLQSESLGLQIANEAYYISPCAAGSRQAWVGRILSLIPDSIHQFLADKFPSLFARGFIFVCKKKSGYF